MNYVVIGATGNTGRVVAEELLQSGQSVRAVGRSADKLRSLVDRGAEAFVADLNNADAVKHAFENIDAAYVMIPPNFSARDFRKYQDEVTDNITDAMAACGTKYVVSLSSVGAEHASGVGPVGGLHYMEKHFNAIPDLNTLHVRAGFFMENLFGAVGMIKSKGIYGAATSADAPWPLIATQDIGRYSAGRLSALNFLGKNVQYLLGPRDVSGGETAKIFAKAFGIESLPYVQFTLPDIKQGMVGAGVPVHIADLFCELYDGFNSGLLSYSRDADSTTNTKLEDFAVQVLKPAFDKA